MKIKKGDKLPDAKVFILEKVVNSNAFIRDILSAIAKMLFIS